MTWLEAIILGIIQGFTEFLPISSSGHLVLAQYIMDINERGVLVEIILHMGTLLAIIIYYSNDLKIMLKDLLNGKRETWTYIFYLGIATIPIACGGLLLDDLIELTFIPSVVIVMLAITGLVLFATFFFSNHPRKEFSPLIVFCIGIAQFFALIPGISRSGITISIAILMGIHHREAAKFSFFLAIPALLGASLIQIIKMDHWQHITTFSFILGFLSSAISGFLVIDWLLAVISKGKFHLFSLYCFAISIITYFWIY